MKKILLIALGGLFVSQLSAQTSKKSANNPIQNNIADQNNTNQPLSTRSRSTPESAGDTVWIEDFATGIPSGWVLGGADNADCPWKYSLTGSRGFYNGGNYPNAAPAMASASAANGFLLCDPDSSNNALYGQPSGTTYQYLESSITTSAINLTGQPQVRLEFEQSFRYNNSPDLEVSVSTDGVNWITYVSQGSIAANSASPDPMTFSVDVSAIVGGSATAYVKLGWSARVYYWMVDDIRFVVPPNNDLAFDTNYFQTTVDTGAQNYYTMVPSMLAALDTIQFSGTVSNKGAVNQPNTKITNHITTPIGSSSISSIGVNVASQGSDSMVITPTFVLDSGIGAYSWALSVNSDSIDAVPLNNALDTIFVEVTDSTFARDRGATGNFTYTSGNPYEMGNMFEIRDSVKATSISVAVGNNSTAGENISVYLYTYNETSSSIVTNLISSHEFYTLDATSIGSVVAYSIPEVLLPPGRYLATYKTYTTDVSFSQSNFVTDPLKSFIDVGSTGSFGWVDYTTPVRLNVSSDLIVCNVQVTAVQTGNNSATVTVTNGTPPYTYLWSNGETVDQPTSLPSGSAPGLTNMVTVTDANLCTAVGTVDILSGLIEAKIEGDISIYPNPNNGMFQLNFEQVKAGNYFITISNVVGQRVYTKEVVINGNYQQNISLLNLESGIYFMDITNTNNEKSVLRFIVN